MSKLLSPSHLNSFHHRRANLLSSFLPKPSIPHLPIPIPTPPPPLRPLVHSHHSISPRAHRFPNSSRNLSVRALESETELGKSVDENGSVRGNGDGDYADGEFVFEERSGWKSIVVKLRMLFALPWERVRKGSVLSMKLRGKGTPTPAIRVNAEPVTSQQLTVDDIPTPNIGFNT
ncbi:hypothetical protein Sjap_024180 [Stephania japonica]|uniref:Uncharacterized protein n=1 Tax=Stephania japonica TaxID=461633 RepID=A0AAP0HJM5_9MAGN